MKKLLLLCFLLPSIALADLTPLDLKIKIASDKNFKEYLTAYLNAHPEIIAGYESKKDDFALESLRTQKQKLQDTIDSIEAARIDKPKGSK